MYKIQTLNKIAKCGISNFDSKKYTISDDEKNPDAIVLRSADMHQMELPESLKAIARAGAGVNNIPVEKCSEKGIVVFNTPGANANAVKELVMAGLLLSSRKIVDAVNWAQTLKGKGDEVPKLVEKGKSAFAGPEIEGKTLGIIGLGAIGVMAANAAHGLGMDVIGYDPYISIDAAWGLSRHVKKAVDMKMVFEKSDYITLHVPLNNETRGMIGTGSIASMKKGVRILNFSRAELVDDDAMEAALLADKISCYVTDFPNDRVIGMKNVLAIPHLGASTPESEDNCAVMAVRQMAEFLESGNITNSVNYPECAMPKSAAHRLCVHHKNIPNMITQITNVFAAKGINIEDFINKSRKDYAYTMLDTNSDISDDDMDDLKKIEGILCVRVI